MTVQCGKYLFKTRQYGNTNVVRKSSMEQAWISGFESKSKTNIGEIRIYAIDMFKLFHETSSLTNLSS